jgi:hypothetical protein
MTLRFNLNSSFEAKLQIQFSGLHPSRLHHFWPAKPWRRVLNLLAEVYGYIEQKKEAPRIGRGQSKR